jgi:triacylglycerol lipase
MKITNIKHWAKDYMRAAHIYGYSVLYRKPPEHFLGYVKENKAPVILIPGLLESWHALQRIGTRLSKKGHPIYVLEGLGMNIKDISESAKHIESLFKEQGIKGAIIISHSKGGLIGKHFMVFSGNGKNVRKLVTISTPFSGSEIVNYIPTRAHQELHPESQAIAKLNAETSVNKKIVSIYGIFDNHVWPLSSSHLEGAKNVQLNVHGHHSILFDKRTIRAVLSEIDG